MSYQYNDRGRPHGVPEYDMRPPPGRRPPPPGNYYPPSDRPRGPPSMIPTPSQGRAPGARYPTRPPPQQYYTHQVAMQSAESLYDGSAFGGADYEEADTWPLPARPFAQSGRDGSPGGSPRGSPRMPPQGSPSTNSPRRPPQRPQRPDHQEPIFEQPRPAPRVAPANKAYHQPPPLPQHPHHGPGQWTGDGYRSAVPSSPSQQLPRGPPPSQPPPSIPDYQMPQALQQTLYGQRNARPPLGPPPSARRGPASYYPQIAPVHPIAEETDSMRGSIRNASVAFDPAHSSYASSNAIPIGIPGIYVEERGSARSLPYEHRPRPSMDQSYEDPPFERIDETSGEGRSDGMESPSPEPGVLIRQASLGKKSKPTLTTVKSGDRTRKEGAGSVPSPQQRDVPQSIRQAPVLDKETHVPRPSVSSISSDGEGDDKVLEAGGLAAAAGAALTVPPLAKLASRQRSPESVLSSGTGLIDASESESDHEVRKKPSKELLAANLPKEQLNRSQPRSPLAPPDPIADEIRRDVNPADSDAPVAKRRPPRINVDAVRDAEARGSLTSLPDLIRRATKLASNLDRGKTASRLGMNFFVDGSDSDQEKYSRSVSDNRRSGISDILNAFPGVNGSPTGSRGGASMSRWSSNMRHSQLPSDSDEGERRRRTRGRRCCGMSLGWFVLLVIVLFLLVVAAVLVPVVLLVILPSQSNSGHSTVTNKALASCQAALTCANGGANIISADGFCRCVCANGYTGHTCQTDSQAGCTTISIGDVSNATIGNEIPLLLKNADPVFNIPLDGEVLLGLFSSADMSCTSENALVTFTNVNKPRSFTDLPTRTLRKRTPAAPADAATTSNGIVYESGAPSAPSSSGAASPGSDSKAIDFAFTSILYIFQVSSSASAAATAQENFQAYFSSGTTADGAKVTGGNVTLGSGFSADLGGLRLRLGNGTVVGG